MKMPLIFKLILISIICFVLAYVFYSLSGQDGMRFISPHRHEDKVTTSQTYRASFGHVKNVTIDTVDADLTLKQSDNDMGGITFDADDALTSAISIRKTGDSITIQLVDKGAGHPESMIVTLPKSVRSVHANTISGDIIVTYLKTPDYALESVSGDIELKVDGADIGRIKVATVSGDIKVSVKGKLAKKIFAEAENGDVDVDSELAAAVVNRAGTDGMTLSSVNGEIDIKSDH